MINNQSDIIIRNADTIDSQSDKLIHKGDMINSQSDIVIQNGAKFNKSNIIIKKGKTGCTNSGRQQRLSLRIPGKYNRVYPSYIYILTREYSGVDLPYVDVDQE